MTKSELIQLLSQRLEHVKASDAKVVVDTMFDAMTASLCRGERIEIRGFGSLTARKRRQRLGRNPKTGQKVAVPEKRVPFFTVSQDLRRRIDAGKNSI